MKKKGKIRYPYVFLNEKEKKNFLTQEKCPLLIVTNDNKAILFPPKDNKNLIGSRI